MGIFSFLFPVLGFLKSIVNGIFQTKHDKMVLAGQTLVQMFLQMRQKGIYDQLTLTTGAQIMLAEMQSDHWLLACWRPLIAVTYCCTWLFMIVLAYWGIMPPSMNDTMLAVFGATNTFVMGYGLLRTNEKNKKNELIAQIVNNIANGKLADPVQLVRTVDNLSNDDEDVVVVQPVEPKKESRSWFNLKGK